MPFSHNLNESAALASQAGVLELANGISLTNVPEPTLTEILLSLSGLGVMSRRRRPTDKHSASVEEVN
jgi:hypothetical protein